MKGPKMKTHILLVLSLLVGLALQVSAGDYAEVVKKSEGLVAYFRFEEPSGTTVRSAVGNFGGRVARMIPSGSPEQMPEMQGTALRTEMGRLGHGIKLDGQSGIKIFRNPALESGWKDFSFELWFKPEILGGIKDGKPVATAVLACRHSPYYYRTSYIQLELSKEGSIRLIQRIKPGSIQAGEVLPADAPNWYLACSETQVKTSPGVAKPGKWYHIVATREKGLLRIFLNGRKVGEASGPEFGELPPYGDWMVGCFTAPEYGSHFKGVIDEFAYYARALSAEEIQKHFEAAGTAEGK